MKKNVLNTHVLKLLESLEQNLSSYTKDHKPEYLHQLRLDIKKIKAVLSFAEKIYNEEFDARSLKPLFKIAGNIREIHINIELLKEDPDSPDGLIPLLTEKENKLIQEFLENDTNYYELISDFRQHLNLPEMLPGKKKIKKYFKKEKQKVNNMFDNIDSEGLHDYRIKIKNILYAFKALPKKLRNKIELNKKRINKQQTQLGKWHDTYAAVDFFSHEDFSSQNPEYVSVLKEKERREFNALLDQL
jgi:CHAD domain-containing protein